MASLRKLFNIINIRGLLLYDEPLSRHCTFRIGGKADLYAVPCDIDDLGKLLSVIRSESIPWFVIGGGANILFSDSGFRGIVIDTAGFNSVAFDGNIIHSGAGVKFSELAEKACGESLSGLEFFYGMPGTTGGSIYMNARCYSQSVSDVLYNVTFIDDNGEISYYTADKADFGYKISPFQNKQDIIIKAAFSLKEGDKKEMLEKMNGFKAEREAKGHYMYPCAGSVFKNNREFGQPSGKIIDSLGLRGLASGGAMVSPLHANIIVNTGKASSDDVRQLVSIIQEKVYKEFGFSLEREIIYID